MDYPFSHFLRHLEAWHNVVKLTSVLIRPEESSQEIYVVDDMSSMALQLRTMHLLSADGYRGALRSYCAARFFEMNRFIALHGDAFSKLGFIMFDDGEFRTVPNAVYRAVHETFRGEPLRFAVSEPIAPVLEKAKSYGGDWQYE